MEDLSWNNQEYKTLRIKHNEYEVNWKKKKSPFPEKMQYNWKTDFRNRLDCLHNIYINQLKFLECTESILDAFTFSNKIIEIISGNVRCFASQSLLIWVLLSILWLKGAVWLRCWRARPRCAAGAAGAPSPVRDTLHLAALGARRSGRAALAPGEGRAHFPLQSQ